MYSETLYSYIPHGTSQGFVWEVSLSDSVTVGESEVVKLNNAIYAWVHDDLDLAESITKDIGKILGDSTALLDSVDTRFVVFGGDVGGRKYDGSITSLKKRNTVKGYSLKVKISGRKHE